jgi:hypothetical protein
MTSAMLGKSPSQSSNSTTVSVEVMEGVGAKFCAGNGKKIILVYENTQTGAIPHRWRKSCGVMTALLCLVAGRKLCTA